ncbi:MAG: DUF1315 family protein [Gammaproteobacteria bacterium]|nr:DUF1315 family protein [Gammaproteobacteria bacterium]
MNSLEDLIASLTPEMVVGLKQAVALGRFPDGREVSAQQRDWMLEAIIRYEESFVPETERTGYVDRGNSECGLPDDALIATTRRQQND